MPKQAQRKTSLWRKFASPMRSQNPMQQKKADWRGRYLPYAQTYMQEPGKPVWTPRDYGRFAEEGYMRNVVAYRCISLVAQAAASVPWYLTAGQGADRQEINAHPLLRLLASPSPQVSGVQFMEMLVSHRMIHGNAYVLKLAPEGGTPQELHLLRPDRVSVIAGAGGMAGGYEYRVGEQVKRYVVDRLTGQSSVLHLKHFHPLNDYYGMAPMEAAAYSIDQHNQAAEWNQALLQNGAKPSGALVVKMAQDGSGGVLSDEQYTRLKTQVDEQFSGTMNAGRPMLLEGGMDWKEMSLSPRDMDFIDAKHSSARDIALAFGVPPQLLGIPGDNTFSNLAEARVSLWEQTILPLLDQVTSALNQWLVPHFGRDLVLTYDEEQISALAPRRAEVWKRVGGAEFLSEEEKRKMLGIGE